jgi:hypothetical protein
MTARLRCARREDGAAGHIAEAGVLLEGEVDQVVGADVDHGKYVI